MNNIKYYKLYSIPLKRFISVHGIKPLSKGVNKETGKTFWVYEVTPELEELLKTWTANKPQK